MIQRRLEAEFNSLIFLVQNDEGMISGMDSRNSLGKSDHVVISFNLTCYMDETDSNQTERSLYNKGDFEKMRIEREETEREREREREYEREKERV